MVVRPAGLVIALPLHHIIEALDLPDAVFLDVVVLVDARFPELLGHDIRLGDDHLVMPAARENAAEAALGGESVLADGDDVLKLEMIEQEAVDRPALAFGEEILEPGAVEAHHAFVADIFAREEHDAAVLGEEAGGLLRAVIVDIIAISPLQAADGVDVLELRDLRLQGGQTRFNLRHSRLLSPKLLRPLTKPGTLGERNFGALHWPRSIVGAVSGR